MWSKCVLVIGLCLSLCEVTHSKRNHHHAQKRHRKDTHGTSSPTHGILPPDLMGISLHESSEMGLCSEPEPLAHKVEKRSYLPPISCTDDHEMEALQSKVHCQPRPRVVHLPWPNDTSFHQMTPSHVEVKLCDGGCFHRKQSCLPLQTKKIKIPVLLARCTIHSRKCEKTCSEVEVEEHTLCGCECKIKRHHCNDKQEYRKELCSCQCRDLSAVEECYESGRVWDPSKCMCRCPLSTLQECSSKYVFDFTNTCKCIPEENNEITYRNERSQDPPGEQMLPSWEILAIAGLVFGILFFVILSCSLTRHVRTLRKQLDYKSEVRSPSGTMLTNGGFPRHPPGSLLNGGSPT
ncbi:uncharacterized protein LOC131892607 [Tigriopus californicus]|nr:uncharacterized protein LOC131892607 [Tigriopus californicus]